MKTAQHIADQEPVIQKKPRYHFCLFIAGNEPNSHQAKENLQHLCADYFPENHFIEVIDVLEQPQRALEYNIFITPALIVKTPPPPLVFYGNLKDTETIISAFDLEQTSL